MARCFVIGPIGDKLASIGTPGREAYEDALEVFEKVILPACKANDLEAIRADQIAVSGEITEQIFRHLRDDEVVVADVSGGNANVMYELGLRHTTNRLTIQIGEYGQLPFDVRAVRTIQFSRSDRGLIDARKELERALAVGLVEGADPVTATRLWQGQAPEAVEEPPTSGDTAEEVEIEDEPGFLERLQSVEESFPRLDAAMNVINDVVVELGVLADRSNSEIDQLNQSGAGASPRLAVVGRFASEMDPLSRRLEEATIEFAETLEETDGSINAILDFIEQNPTTLEDSDTREFLETMGGLAVSAREGFGELNTFAAAAEGLGAISKRLREPGRRIGKAVRTMANAAGVMDNWEARSQPLLASAASEAKAKDSDNA
jgi:hypothetical protein